MVSRQKRVNSWIINDYLTTVKYEEEIAKNITLDRINKETAKLNIFLHQYLLGVSNTNGNNLVSLAHFSGEK